MATATAVLNVETYPYTLIVKDDNDRAVETIEVRPVPNRSIDAQVSYLLRERGFFTVGEPFDYMAGVVYRLTQKKG